MHLFFVVHAVTLIIFLMQSGDIQLNPGPINKGIKKLYYMVHTENIIKVMHAVIVLGITLIVMYHFFCKAKDTIVMIAVDN